MTLQFVPNYVDVSVEPATWARAREAEGWYGLAVADHLWDRGLAYPHVWVALGAMAASTSRVMLTSSFANNLVRSPVEFAQASLAVQQASSGRFEAGLGAGWARAEIEQIGHRYPPSAERISRYIEAITIAGELLRTRHCSFHGDYYGVDVDILGPDVPPPPLVASVGGPRSIRKVSPLVDRVELKVSSSATRGGELDYAAFQLVDEDHLDSLVALVRAVSPDVPLGMFLQVGVGDNPRLRQLSATLGDSWMSRFIGPPAQVAEALMALESHGVDRVQLTPYLPETFELLAPHLGG
jgi:alkanesulfonate monooxygenase SsuD/methylene tetrahydromethanopterin reductase-like flavin-dependent oxidoreductase (luciferase family)